MAAGACKSKLKAMKRCSMYRWRRNQKDSNTARRTGNVDILPSVFASQYSYEGVITPSRMKDRHLGPLDVTFLPRGSAHDVKQQPQSFHVDAFFFHVA